MGALQVEIIPFQQRHQVGIDSFIAVIANEFSVSIGWVRTRERKYLSLMPDKYWVALVSDTVVGTIGLSLSGNEAIEIKKMFLDKTYRGQGIADSLLKTMLQWASDNGITTTYLGAMSQFKAAHKFYEKHAFKQIGLEDLPPNFRINPVDDLFYKKNDA